jgi:SAM-dependent methyltransferase
MINTRVTPDSSYYGHLRPSLLRLARGVPRRVLDVGCGRGQTLVHFKRMGATCCIGVELVEEVAEFARTQAEINRVVTGDIEAVHAELPRNEFDLIVVSHVLEHVRNPWEVLAGLVGALRLGGQLIGSLPNVRCLEVLKPLVLHGRWDYATEGILDWTHLRFFTRSGILDLLDRAGLSDLSICGEVAAGGKLASIHRVSFGLLEEFCAFTFNFSGTRPLHALPPRSPDIPSSPVSSARRE